MSGSTQRRLVRIFNAADAAEDFCNIGKYIGPDLNIPRGQVGMILIDAIVEDQAKTGFTATTPDGGVLSIRLTPHGQRNRRANAATINAAKRGRLLKLLESWPERAPCSLRRYAAEFGIPLFEIRKACFLNPGRTPPPLRMEYERARARWRAEYNARRSRRPNA